MMGTVSARHLLGKSDEGQVILLAGPRYDRMERMAALMGIETRDVGRVSKHSAEILTAEVRTSGRSIAFLASVPEVEGLLDRSSFGPNLADLAFFADRVVYAGADGSVLVWPQPEEAWIEVRGGRISAHRQVDVVVDDDVTPLASAR